LAAAAVCGIDSRMARRPDPFHAPDDEARRTARALLAAARHAALAYLDPETGTPGISRIGFGLDGDGTPLTLVSSLSAHQPALAARPDCAVMVGEPGGRGDPLAQPRLMLRARARLLDRAAPDHPARRAAWLAQHPKAALYVDFADFAFVRLEPVSAVLNAGFARAFRLAAADLAP
jgi:hypothetical protein